MPIRRYLLAIPLLAACQEYTLGGDKDDDPVDPVDSDVGFGLCSFDWDGRNVDPLEECGPYEIGGFNPFIEWTAGRTKTCTSQPIVGDVNQDGVPDVIVNLGSGLPGGAGELWVFSGDDGHKIWSKGNAKLGYGAPPAIADLDRDGDVEIVGVRAHGSQLPGPAQSKYSVVMWDHEGNEIAASTQFSANDFDYATAPVISDMDKDGSPEIIAGRVIFRSDLTLRGRGTKGRGSWGKMPGGMSEASVPAVADVDLDGIEEVIVGNAMYTPDGAIKWESRQEDGMVSVGNLDDDPEAEWVVSSFNTVRFVDTDGTVFFGPKKLNQATNIVSPSAIANVDDEPYPEVIVAGGSELVVFNHDGTRLWADQGDPELCDDDTDAGFPFAPTTPGPSYAGGGPGIQDCSGATGASVFDFEGDGIQEVVYIDEIAMYAYDGKTGLRKFYADDHRSATMMDYPTIADVDADGSAEIVVCHDLGTGYALSVYGNGDGRWAPTRGVWNQHAYSIHNINDDLTVPTSGLQGFQADHNSYHAATDRSLYDGSDLFDLQTEIVETCEAECDLGYFYVAIQPINKSPTMDLEPGVPITLYAVKGGALQKLETVETTELLPPGKSGDEIVFQVRSDLVEGAEAIRAVIDNRGGAGPGMIRECIETDNSFEIRGPFCK